MSSTLIVLAAAVGIDFVGTGFAGIVAAAVVAGCYSGGHASEMRLLWPLKQEC